MSSSTITTTDDLVAFLQSNPAAEQLNSVLKSLLKQPHTQTPAPILLSFLQNNQDPLLALNPTIASSGLLFFLIPRVSRLLNAVNSTTNAPSPADVNHLWTVIGAWSDNLVPPQLVYFPEYVVYLGRLIHQLAYAYVSPQRALRPMHNIIYTLYPPATLSPLHSLFVQAIIDARQFRYGGQFVLHPIDDVDPAVKYQDHLTYHALGGVILAVLGQWKEASDMLEIAVSAPGTGVSAIQVDAYKRLVLVQLMAFGKLRPLPSYTSSTVSSAVKSASALYLEYAQAYTERNIGKMFQIRNERREVFENDRNFGLIHHCDESVVHRVIQRLTETYMTLSLSDIAKTLNWPLNTETLSRLEDIIKEMLAAGEIHGSITSTTSSDPSSPSTSTSLADLTVTFVDDPEPYDTQKTVKQLSRAIYDTKGLDRYLSANANRLEKSKEFVTKAYNQASRDGVNPLGGGAFGMGGDDLDISMGTAGDWDEDDL